MSELKFPTEQVDLPSKGKLYTEDNPLSSGKIEMKYMTAKEEDILTNQNYIKQGIVIDKLLKSLIIDKKVNYDDLIVGDKNAILIAARILGYGQNYNFNYRGEDVSVDLTSLETRYLDESTMLEGKNEFAFTLPHTKTPITYKILNSKDEKKVESEVKSLKKINKQASPELSTRLKHMILSVSGETSNEKIREFVDNYMLARDSRAFREHLRTTQPDIVMEFDYMGDEGIEEGVVIPMTAGFLWPDSWI